MNNIAPAVPTHDGRGQRRTHLFVAAILCTEAGSVPVNIRNVSASGALIESIEIPEPGTRAILKRGILQATGHVKWKVNGKAGVAFETSVRVADWLTPKASADQQRADEIVADFKSARLAKDYSGAVVEATHRLPGIRTELLMLDSELRQLETGLINDVVLVATHPEIQILDVVLQRIGRLISQVDIP